MDSTTGGLVNVVTRSGTNTYHGSVFEFIRNNYIDATNFFATAKDTLHQNQFGGTFGGPILRDKLFAFAGYQRLQADQSTATTQAHVPTAANLAGDFSVTDGPGCTANGKFIQLVDPLTGANWQATNIRVNPHTMRRRWRLEKYLPPINPAVDTQNCGLVSYAIPSKQSDNQFVTRVDYTINAKNNLYGRYFIDGYQAPAFFSPTNILITTQSGNLQRVQIFHPRRGVHDQFEDRELRPMSRCCGVVTTADTPLTTSTPLLSVSISIRPSPTVCNWQRATNSPSAAVQTRSPISTTTPSPSTTT